MARTRQKKQHSYTQPTISLYSWLLSVYADRESSRFIVVPKASLNSDEKDAKANGELSLIFIQINKHYFQPSA